jgi:hypothetical protein
LKRKVCYLYNFSNITNEPWNKGTNFTMEKGDNLAKNMISDKKRKRYNKTKVAASTL